MLLGWCHHMGGYVHEATRLLLDLQLELSDTPPGTFDLFLQQAGGIPAVYLTDTL